MRIIYGSHECRYVNPERLEQLRGKSILAVSNHIKPRNKFLNWITMPYDAYIIRAMFLKYGIYSTALTSYDAGKVSKKSKLSKAQKRKEQLVKGIVVSMDLIPLNRNESDPDTIKDFKLRIQKGNMAVGIFPEGTWFRGYRKTRKLQGGVAVLSKRYDLPILPVYINAYNLNKPWEIAVGEPIIETGNSAHVMDSIKSQFLQLRSDLNLK